MKTLIVELESDELASVFLLDSTIRSEILESSSIIIIY